MSRDRFKAVLSNLHFSDNEQCVPCGQPNNDCLFKIRGFFDHIVKEFSSSLDPSENLTVDEGVCGFRGCILFRVFLKNKLERYGIKYLLYAMHIQAML